MSGLCGTLKKKKKKRLPIDLICGVWCRQEKFFFFFFKQVVCSFFFWQPRCHVGISFISFKAIWLFLSCSGHVRENDTLWQGLVHLRVNFTALSFHHWGILVGCLHGTARLFVGSSTAGSYWSACCFSQCWLFCRGGGVALCLVISASPYRLLTHFGSVIQRFG